MTGGTAGFTAVQTYTYDALNRIYDAKENIDGNPTANWKQTFDYDRYGNRRFNELNTTTTTKNCTDGTNPTVCAIIRFLTSRLWLRESKYFWELL
jgi:hypothetical protein